MQLHPPPPTPTATDTHRMESRRTVFVSKHLETDNVMYVLVILRQRKLTMRPVWRYNVGDLFVARPNVF